MTYAEIVILATLMKKGRHGYEIKKTAELIFGDSGTINNNTLYTSLHRFQKMGAVVSEVHATSGKPDRHVYRLTENGKEIFREMVRDFPPETAKNDMEFFARVAFFRLLEPEERLAILRARKKAMEERLARYEELCKTCGSRSLSYEEKVVRFMGDQTRSEIGWIDSIEP